MEMPPSSSYWEKFTNHIPSILLHLTLRFTLLRTICLTTLPMFFTGVVERDFNSFLTYFSLAVFLHHFATAFGPYFTLPGALDLVLVIAEVQFYNPGLEAINRWSTRLTVFTGALAWTTTISLAFLAVLRIVEGLKRGWPFLWNRYDVTAPEYRHAWRSKKSKKGKGKSSRTSTREEGEGEGPPDQRAAVQNAKTLTPNDVLFGRSIWKSNFLGETYWIIISRGIFAALLVVLISLFALYLVILEPVRETGVTPIKESRTTGFPTDFKTSEVPWWNVVLGKSTNQSLELAHFGPAVKVEVLRPNNTSDKCPQVEVDDDSMRIWPYIGETYALDLVSFHCPGMAKEDRGTYDDILVTVNFTMLNITSDLIAETRLNSVQVFMGRTSYSRELVRRTPSTSLIPGVNLIGFGERQIRQQFSEPLVSAFGLFDSYFTFISFEMGHLWQDPRAGSSRLIAQGPNVSTLRIVTPYNFVEWKVIQQRRDKSVLSGFASIGGLWTFLTGIFTALFGTSIMRIIFGTKPISVFGVTRTLVGDRIREACRQEYPRIQSDLNVRPTDKGLISFLADHLVDFDFLLKDAGGQSPASSQEDVPPISTGSEEKSHNLDHIPLLPIVNDTPSSSPLQEKPVLV